MRQFQKLAKDVRCGPAVAAAALYGLAILIRPVNALSILMLPFFFSGMADFKSRIRGAFAQKYRLLARALVVFIAFLFIQPMLWYWQTGHWLVDTYAGEGFDFFWPPLHQSLFSIRKGWFVFTPLALLALASMVFIPKKDRYKALTAGGFLFICLYVVSSWHAWWYADSFGQRAMIDFYGCLALIPALAGNTISEKKPVFKTFMALVIGCCLILNLVQNYQMTASIIPGDGMTWNRYQRTFLQLHPVAEVSVDAERFALIKEIFYDVESATREWPFREELVTKALARSGAYAALIDSAREYSLTYRYPIGADVALVCAEAFLFAREPAGSPQLVIELKSAEGEIKFYRAFQLEPFMRTGQWFRVVFPALFTLPSEQNDVLQVFFWYPNAGPAIYIDDFRISQYRAVRKES